MLFAAVVGSASPEVAVAALQPVSCPAELSGPTRMCGRVVVPRDRGAADGRRIALFATVVRKSSVRRGALVVLAGGPGESATAYLNTLIRPIEDATADLDVVALDLRGTGRSQALDCPRMQADPTRRSITALVDCADSPEADLNHYTTADNVHDLEALREAIGEKRIALYGISYGARLALAYASTYPNRVSRLLLDSVVPSSLEPPPTFKAMRRVLRGRCAAACHGRDPVAAVTAVISRLRRTPLRGATRDARGVRRSITVTPSGLYDTLLAADEDPALRAALPAAVLAAERSDGAALLRLAEAAARVARPDTSPRRNSAGAYVATTCGDVVASFGTTGDPASRLAAARTKLESEGPTSLIPFDSETALKVSPLGLCANWPLPPGSSPGVVTAPPPPPTLVVAGDEDLRAPLESATAVASRLPGGILLRVRSVGHAVLGAEGGLCARRLARRFIAALRVSRMTCAGRPPAWSVPVPPRSLNALRPVRVPSRRVGRLLRAIALTLNDAALAQALQVGGLRHGWVTPGSRLHSYEYIRGVRLTGVPIHGGRVLALRLRGATLGRIEVRRDGRLSGRIGRQAVRATVKLLSGAELFH